MKCGICNYELEVFTDESDAERVTIYCDKCGSSVTANKNVIKIAYKNAIEGFKSRKNKYIPKSKRSSDNNDELSETEDL